MPKKDGNYFDGLSFNVNNPFIPSANKNAPKSFFKISPVRNAAVRPPRTEVATAGTISQRTLPPSISPLFLCTERLIAAMGRKAIKLAA